jgi:ribosome biogenesis GTPase A
MVETMWSHRSKWRTIWKKPAIKRAAWIRENPGITVEAILKEHPRLFDTPGMVSVRQINHYIQWLIYHVILSYYDVCSVTSYLLSADP